MFELVQNRLRFSFTFVDSIDGTPGILGPDGSWSGLIGMLQRKEIDFGIQGNSMLSQRTEVECKPLNLIIVNFLSYVDHTLCMFISNVKGVT